MNSVYTNCDAAIARLPRLACDTRHPNWLLTTSILASGLALIDVSVVNVGLPAVGAAFNAGATDLQWIINAYLLPLSALLLLGGAIGDRYGHARLLVVGLGIFAVASVGCGSALSLRGLLVSRGLQGVGAAVIMPNSLAILGEHFTGEARGRAIGIWASAGAVMAAISPVLGGWLIDTAGWRSTFLINVPPTAVVIVLALVFSRDVSREVDAPPLDLAGGALASLSLGTLTWGLTVGSGPSGWTLPAILSIVVGVAFFAGFLSVEVSKSGAAMMPLDLFRSSSFVGITLLTFLMYGALSALLVLAPFVLIQTSGYSSAQSGLALLPFAIVLAVASPLFGSVAAKIGPRIPLIAGPLVVAGGFAVISRYGPQQQYWVAILPATLMVALGLAGAAAPLTIAVFASVDSQHSGSASGLNSAVARIGGLVATALLGNVLGKRGPELVNGFHTAAIICALTSCAASASAFFFITIGPSSKSSVPAASEAH